MRERAQICLDMARRMEVRGLHLTARALRDVAAELMRTHEAAEGGAL